MGVALKVEIQGLREAQRKAIGWIRGLHGGVVFGAVSQGVLLLTRDTMINDPVVTGRLRAGNVPSVTQIGTMVVGVVTNRVVYAPYVEFGTRKMAARRPMGRAFDKDRERVVSMILGAIRSLLR